MFLHETDSKKEKEPELQFEFVNRVSEQEKQIIQQAYKSLSEKCFKKDKPGSDKPYKVILGEGTFSKVRLARAQINGKTFYFALRKIRRVDELETAAEGKAKSPLNRAKVYEMTEKELLLLETLKDVVVDNVAIPLAVIKKQNKLGEAQLYQVFPLADMGNGNKLIELLHSGSISESERNALFNHIALILLNTVSFLNDRDFYVNDIKPENLLFSILGDIWLSDFGSACRKINGEYIEASSVSDPKYLHPAVLNDKIHEMKINKKDRGLNNDGWALALTLLELYSEETRKIAADMKSHIYKHRDENYNLDSIKKVYAAQIKILQASKSFAKMPEFFQSVIIDLLNLNINERKKIVDIVNAHYPDDMTLLSQSEVGSLFEQMLLSSQQTSTKSQGVAIPNTSGFEYVNSKTANEGYQDDEVLNEKTNREGGRRAKVLESGYQDDEGPEDKTQTRSDLKADKAEDSTHAFFSNKSGGNKSTLHNNNTSLKSPKKI